MSEQMNIPEKGIKAYAQAITVRRMLALQEQHGVDTNDFNMAMLAECIVDENDKQIFDKDSILDLTMPTFTKVQSSVLRVNHMDDDEDAVKN